MNTLEQPIYNINSNNKTFSKFKVINAMSKTMQYALKQLK